MDTAIKIMYGAINAYSLLIGTAMTWHEELVNRYPKTMGLVVGVIIGSILFK